MIPHTLGSLTYYPWLIFSVTVLGAFMATLDASIVNVALPIIAKQLDADLSKVQWVVTAYLLAISSMLPLFGKVGDMFGRRRVYSVGFLLFTSGSILCGMAFSINCLVGARVFQAIGAAMLMANAPALVIASFPGKARGRALGLIGSVVALGSMTGPSLGGMLVGMFGWQSIFYINLPIGMIGYLLARVILPKDEHYSKESFDFFGAILFAVGMVGLLLMISHGQQWGWFSTFIITGSIASVMTLSIFVWHEGKVKHPMIDLSLFRHWPFLAGSLAGFLSFMAMFSNIILLPFYLDSVLGLTPTQIGLVITPFPLVMGIIAPISGYLSERISPAVLTCSGMSSMALALLYLATLGVHSTLWEVAAGQAVMGFGNGMFQSPNNNSVLSSVDPAKLGVASGIGALMRNIGMVVGIAVAVSVFENRQYSALVGIVAPTPSEQTTAFLFAHHTALIVGACFASIGAIISLKRDGYNDVNNIN